MDVSVEELLPLVEGTLLAGDLESRVRGFGSLKEATEGELAFYADGRYQKQLIGSKATVILLPPETEQLPEDTACIAVKDPSRAFEIVVETYGLQPLPFVPGVHPTAVMGKGVTLDSDRVSVGPNAVIGEGTFLAAGVRIGAGAYVGPEVRIGADSAIAANATIHHGCILGERVSIHSNSVIGADGFGYVFEDGRHRKIRQAGRVQIDNDVEIGAGTMVDRARFGRTWIGEGTKIDNHVQIGHNVVIGRHCIVVAHTGIAGSATIGDYVVIAAQSGVAGHVTVGSRAILGGRSGVTKDLPGGKTYLGNPAIPMGEEQRARAGIRRIPRLLARIADLESRLAASEECENPAD